MIKTTTLVTTSQTSETNSQNLTFKGSVQKQLNPSVCEPSDETIQNILNYSKALKVKHSENTGAVMENLN